jgi:hypothetical protein
MGSYPTFTCQSSQSMGCPVQLHLCPRKRHHSENSSTHHNWQGNTKFVAIRNKTSYHISLIFDSEWLCCYPRPARVVYDKWKQICSTRVSRTISKLWSQPSSNNHQESKEQLSHWRSPSSCGRYVTDNDLLWFWLLNWHAVSIICSWMGCA